MTSTSVKDVGSILNNLSTNATYQSANNSTVSFQSVLNSQTRGSEQTQEPAVKVKTQESSSVKEKEPVLAKDDQITNRKAVENGEAPDETVDIKDVEELEEAMEILGATAMELMEQIGNTFGVSMEEMQDVLGQMELLPTDLLDSEKLSSFLLQIAGAEDSMMLLTNESLYGDYKQLMQELSNLLSQDSGMKGMTMEELKAAIEQNLNATQEDVAVPDAEPIVEVTVETEDGVSEENTVKQEAQFPGTNPVSEGSEALNGQTSDGEQKGQDGQDTNPTDKMNLFQQNLKTEVVVQPEAPVYSTGSGFSVETQDIMRQIMDYMRVQIKPDVSNLEMQLHPASLGTLQINVTSKGGVLTANFVTENEAVKAALETQMVQLKENFAQQGIKVEAIEVTVQTHQFEQSLEQGQNREQSSPENRSRTRRIRLDGPLGMEDFGEMEAEEQLAAEMMIANGNTVDYSV
ncbi:MAG: flagellar hook-length control protein FliK [Lachnospiraceae bacterium]|nr:flagellar hook-length control protein FliK [Lachnospiraceae bacterium]